MLQHVLHVYKMNLGYAKRLVADMSADQMCEQPHGVVNHPAWSLALSDADPAALAQPLPNEKMRAFFPTVGDFAVFLMTAHEMDHLGQIAAWRRAMGLGPAA